jgi:hypothetical protein
MAAAYQLPGFHKFQSFRMKPQFAGFCAAPLSRGASDCQWLTRFHPPVSRVHYIIGKRTYDPPGERLRVFDLDIRRSEHRCETDSIGSASTADEAAGLL